MSRKIISHIILSTLLFTGVALPAHADTGLPVYGVVLATLAAGIAGSAYGNNLFDVMSSGTAKHQVSLLAGHDGDIDIARLAYRWDFNKPLWKRNDFLLSSSLEASAGAWQTNKQYADKSNTDIGLTPMFKIKKDATSPWYAEVGVGAHYLTNVRIKDYSKSTQFQFGDQFGLGWENDQFRVGYRYLHISNGNIEIPNPSTDFQTLEIGYRY